MGVQTAFKKVMGNYPTGVCVMTTMAENELPLGLTVNSFASVSLNPTLILWSIDKHVHSFDIFAKCKKFLVHILSSNQPNICTVFASKNVDRFSMCEWQLTEDNQPMILGSAAVLECTTFQTVEAGDHLIIIGTVVKIHDEDVDPLLYHKRQFGPIPSDFYEK